MHVNSHMRLPTLTLVSIIMLLLSQAFRTSLMQLTTMKSVTKEPSIHCLSLCAYPAMSAAFLFALETAKEYTLSFDALQTICYVIDRDVIPYTHASRLGRAH